MWELEMGKGDVRSQGKDGTKCPQITLLGRLARFQAEAALNPTLVCLLLFKVQPGNTRLSES